MEVVSAAHGVFGPLLWKLTALLAKECGRLKGVRREIRALRSELTSMHAAVKVYTKLEDPDDQVKTWISLVRELAYDIEDVFDKFIHHLGHNRDHGGFKEFFRKSARRLKTLGSHHGFVGQIDDLKARIKQVKDLKDSYKLNDNPSSTTGHAAVDPRLHALFAEEAHLVGVDGPRDHLVKWMWEEGNNSTKQHRKVLSIVGFGGLGKTTLANEIYRKIHGHFVCRAFVSISQNPDIKKIIKDVISQVAYTDESTKDTDDWDERKCIAKLRKVLQDKRYLVIVDDIWSTSAWDAIKCAFPENNHASRIVITTRIVNVARSCCPGGDDHVYEMEALSELNSRELFFRRIFGSQDHCPSMLKEVSNKILKKCGGLPLAIVSISGLLANKPFVKEEWEKVKRSIGSALETTGSLEGMVSILCLSYNDLPPNLKTCLLYLSAFPEDCVISRETLVRRWIAEGFIAEDRGQSQQEVAESYFYELINKNMIQPVNIAYDGKVYACRVHDMMLEIIIMKSAEENFITVVGGGQTTLINPHGVIRRLSIQQSDHKIASTLENEDLSHVRSLTVTSMSCIEQLPSLAEFKALRVLDFAQCKGVKEYVMNGMEKLVQLKYLRLGDNGMLRLPPGIVKLGDLETLDIRATSVQKLPDRIIQLTKLQHLHTPSFCRIPDGIGNMKNLQVTSGSFSVMASSVDAVRELGSLVSLNELQIFLDDEKPDMFKRHKDMLLLSLCKLSSTLQRFGIDVVGGSSIHFLDSWCPLPLSLQILRISSGYHFTNIPKCIAPALTSLAYLSISLTELTKEGLQTLGELPGLLRLYLQLKNRPKDKVTVQSIGFPSLKEFEIFSKCPAYVTFIEGAMPILEDLQVTFAVSVAKAYGFYFGIEHLPCLKKARVTLDNVGATSSESKAATAAIRNGAGVHPKHPTVIILDKPDEEDNEKTDNDEGKEQGGRMQQ